MAVASRKMACANRFASAGRSQWAQPCAYAKSPRGTDEQLPVSAGVGHRCCRSLAQAPMHAASQKAHTTRFADIRWLQSLLLLLLLLLLSLLLFFFGNEKKTESPMANGRFPFSDAAMSVSELHSGNQDASGQQRRPLHVWLSGFSLLVRCLRSLPFGLAVGLLLAGSSG